MKFPCCQTQLNLSFYCAHVAKVLLWSPSSVFRSVLHLLISLMTSELFLHSFTWLISLSSCWGPGTSRVYVPWTEQTRALPSWDSPSRERLSVKEPWWPRGLRTLPSSLFLNPPFDFAPISSPFSPVQSLQPQLCVIQKKKKGRADQAESTGEGHEKNEEETSRDPMASWAGLQRGLSCGPVRGAESAYGK